MRHTAGAQNAGTTDTHTHTHLTIYMVKILYVDYIHQVTRKDGKVTYRLVHVDEKPSLHIRESVKSIESDFQYEKAEKDLLLDDTFHLGDLLSSYHNLDEEESTKKTKAVE